ncbi:MAG: aminoacetone oxidase family FAD-binding enzyme [Tissierellia bacterium]|nr:aminoacetone oxidase family FAD-binding enzyme [Tissierellia bacterium]
MKIVIIGAGVSSLAFASFIKGDIDIYDKNQFAGRKLLATGNGRCNFTNANLDISKYQGKDKKMIAHAIKSFGYKELIDHLNLMGILTTNLPSGRYYPATMMSNSIRDALFLKAKENGAKFHFGEEIIDFDFKKKLIFTKEKRISYDKLIIASGGKTLKNSGSDGYILEKLKKYFKITNICYGIAPLETNKKLKKSIKGVKIKAKASLIIDNKLDISSIDDIIFQDYGLTGTAIFDLSNRASIALNNGKDVRISIDFFNDYSKEELYLFFKSRQSLFPKRNMHDFMIGLLNEKLIDFVLEKSKIQKNTISSKLSDKDLINLVRILKSMEFKIKDIHNKDNAQVTIGGIDPLEIDSINFNSKKFPDVFFIGEIVDVSGDCGGYNIQWAFSSAYAAYLKIRS